MNKRIIYPNDNGGVSIIIPAFESKKQILVTEAVYKTIIITDEETKKEHEELELISPAVYRDQTDEEFLQFIADKDVPAGKPFQIVDASDIPEDRTFRDAWEFA